MSGAFIYFIPATEIALAAPSVDELRELNLYRIVGPAPSATQCTLEGVIGTAVAHPSVPEPHVARCLGAGEPVEWMNRDRCRMGWLKSAPPGPNELQRGRIIEGREIRMGDDRHWHIPAIWPLGSSSNALPVTMANLGGEWTGKVLDEFRWLESILGRMRGQFFDGKVEPLLRSEAARLIANALMLNYRVDTPEVSALGLIRLGDTDTTLLEEVTATIFDADGFAHDFAERAESLEAIAT